MGWVYIAVEIEHPNKKNHQSNTRKERTSHAIEISKEKREISKS